MNTLPSGQTLVGKYYLLDRRGGSHSTRQRPIRIAFPTHIQPRYHYHNPNAAPTANCPGNEDNPPAHQVSVYSEERDGVDMTFSGDSFDHDRVDRFGAGPNVKSSTAVGLFWDVGAWAVAAP